LNTMVIDTE